MPQIEGTELEASKCQRCGATRPLVELSNEQGCANCANLKLMAEQLAAQKAAVAEAEETTKKLTEELKNLPDLDKPASSLYDNERGVWWLGLNLKQDKAEPISLMMLMDQSKVGMLTCLADWQVREQRRKNLVIGVPSAVKKVVSEINLKAQAAKDRVKELFSLPT